MVELIDREYNRFVDLSTNLSSAQETLGKLNSEGSLIVDDLSPAALGIANLSGEISSLEHEKFHCQNGQDLLRNSVKFYDVARRADALLELIRGICFKFII